MKMQDWVAALDSQIVMSQRKILEGKGKISHDEAMEKAEREYSLFRQKELANLKSDFDSAGINQTRHRIICDVKVGVSAIIPGCSSYTEAENSFTVSETVLAGEVPESFTNVDTTDDLYDDINNFITD